MKRSKNTFNSNDVARKAIFTRRLIRLGQQKELKKSARQLHRAAPANEGEILREMREKPYRYTRRQATRSPGFLMMSYLRKLRGYDMPHETPGTLDVIWSCLGSFAGIFILMMLDQLFFTGDQHLLLGSFGASSLIIFGSPHSAFAQPRSVVGGQIISAFTGVSVFMLLGDYPLLAAPMGVTLAFFAMQMTKTMHPPGGATALIAVSGHPVVQQMGYIYTILPVGAGISILFILGVIINNISRNRLYPLRWWQA